MYTDSVENITSIKINKLIYRKYKSPEFLVLQHGRVCVQLGTEFLAEVQLIGELCQGTRAGVAEVYNMYIQYSAVD